MGNQKIKVKLEQYNPPFFPVRIKWEVGGIPYSVPFTNVTSARSYVMRRFADPVLVDERAEIAH